MFSVDVRELCRSDACCFSHKNLASHFFTNQRRLDANQPNPRANSSFADGRENDRQSKRHGYRGGW